jgi:rhodanese-related sulfurtransferase
MVQTISREELHNRINRGDKFLLVETLPEVAYEHVHLPGAINLPPDRIKDMAVILLPDKTADIVVYCSGPT